MAMDQEKNIKDILDIVSFIKDNAANKEDLKHFVTKEDLDRFATKEDLERFATKEDLENFVTKGYFEEKLNETKNELMNHIDTFIGLHQKLDIELTSLRSKYDRLESAVKKVMEHLHLNF